MDFKFDERWLTHVEEEINPVLTLAVSDLTPGNGVSVDFTHDGRVIYSEAEPEEEILRTVQHDAVKLQEDITESVKKLLKEIE